MKWKLFCLILLWPALSLGQTPSTYLRLSATAPTIGTLANGGESHQANSGTVYEKITWSTSGTVSACTVAVDSSADGSSWSAGGVITGQTCTSSGNSAVVNITANYARINITALSGGGTVTVNYFGYQTNPSGGGGSGTVTGVLGTTNQITSDGSSTTPTLSIPSTFIAPGTISAVTSIDATKLTGNLPAINGAALTSLPLCAACAPLASPTFTGTPAGTTATNTDNSTRLATTAYMQSVVGGGDFISVPYGTVANQSTPFSSSANKMWATSITIPVTKTVSKIIYKIGTTADNTSATYDVGFASGTPGGTCTTLGHVGPTAGTTFSPTANTVFSLNFLSPFVLPATTPTTLVYLLLTSSATSAQATFISGTTQTQAQVIAVSITTGGTIPASFTCPPYNSTLALANGTNMPTFTLQ